MKKIIFATMALLSGCMTMTTTKGMKLYDNVVIEIITDNALLSPQNIDKDFIDKFHNRMIDLSESVIAKKGNFNIVSQCGPRTTKIILDVTNISIGNYVRSSIGFWPGSSVAVEKNNFKINASSTLVDCVTGRKFGKDSYNEDGDDIMNVMKQIASNAMGDAYDFQFERIPR